MKELRERSKFLHSTVEKRYVLQIVSHVSRMEVKAKAQDDVEARVYFFHFIMHNWSDDVLEDILPRTAVAMEKRVLQTLVERAHSSELELSAVSSQI